MLFTKRMLLGMAAMAALALCWPVAGARAGAYEIEADSRAAHGGVFPRCAVVEGACQ